MIIGKNKIYFYLSSLIMVLLLEYAYQFYIHPTFDGIVSSFGKYGYPAGEFNIYKFFIVLIFIALLVYNLPSKVSSPSDLIIVFYYYFSIVPYLSLYALDLINSDNLYYIDFLSILIFYLIMRFVKIERKLQIVSDNKKYFKIVIIVALLISSYLFIKFGAKSLVTSLLDVYNQREIFSKSGFFINYLVSFFSFGIIAYIIFMYEKNRSTTLMILLMASNIIIFLSTGSKLIFGSTFLILLLSRRYDGYFISYKIGLYLNLVIYLSILMSILFNSHIMMSLLVRRTFILPAQIFYLYFKHFTINGYNMMSAYTHNLFTTHYISSAPHVIGSIYFREETHANSGMISDAYANFGILGIIIYSVFLLFVFYLINRLNTRLSNKLTPIFAGIAISLTNSGLLAVFIYQILPIIIVFYFLVFFESKISR